MESLARIPMKRIAVLIGTKGSTRRAIEEASGAKLKIDSRSGDISCEWEEDFDPIKQLKLPGVIKAIGRGMNPERAIQLMQDDHFLEMIDIREYVGKQANQQRRIRSRIIGRNGRIRELIEEHSGAEVAIYGSTIVIIGGEDSIPLASQAIQRLLHGAEHSSVLKNLEGERRRRRMSSRNLDSIQTKDDYDRFDVLVPGLAAARRSKERRLKSSQVDPDDADAVTEMLELSEDEEISYEEE
jgi:ribosomal RNA assembly protein